MSFRNQREFDAEYGRRYERTNDEKKDDAPKMSVLSRMLQFLPCVKTITEYKASYLPGDLIAGFTVTALNVPQGMAFAALAGLPPVIGIYMGFFAPLVYFIFGTSHHLSVGGFAPISMMLFASISTISQQIEDEEMEEMEKLNSLTSANQTRTKLDVDELKIAVGTSIGLISGLILIFLGFLRLGFIGSYFSNSLIKGFTFGVAIQIATSQAVKVLGIVIESQSGVGSLIFRWIEIFKNIGSTNFCSLIIGIVTCLLLFLCQFLSERYKTQLRGFPIPAELSLVVLGTMVSHFASLHEHFHIQVIGVVPAGVPFPNLDPINTLLNHPSAIGPVIQIAVPAALVSFAISLAMAKLLAQKNGYLIDSNQELFALGLVETFTSFFGCFTNAASPPRSNLQSEVGGKTHMTSIFSCVLMLAVMMFAGPLMTSLPFSVLGVIVIFALRAFFLQASDLPRLFRQDKNDFSIWVITALTTVLVNLTYGLLSGISLSLLLVLWRSQNPNISELGQIKGTDKYRDVSSYEEITKIPNALIFRFGMSLYFANSELFVSKVKDEISERSKDDKNPGLNYVIVDGGPFNFVDHSGAAALTSLFQHCRLSNIKFLLVLSDLYVLEKLERENLVETMGSENIFPSLHDAALSIQLGSSRENGEKNESSI